MEKRHPNHAQLSIVPLGAGDLIDRAVRFYRQNFVTFVLIAAPPVVVGTLLSLGWIQVSRELFFTSGTFDPAESFAYVIFTFLGTAVIWFTETVATLSVMGGASRNFVRHLLFGEAISFRDTYRNTWERLAGLIAASSLIAVLLGSIGLFIFYLGAIVAAVFIAFVVVGLESAPVLAAIAAVAIGISAAVGVYWLICLLASRFAYVPQVMLVENQGVFASVGRSMSLASGNVKRFAALFAFTTVATYSALAILYVPLGWYAWYEGVEIFGFGNELVPAWYEIASQLVWQASFILLTPVWMVGLCLLYVDERVRHEGYDIELMAASRLGEIPPVPESYVNPLQPALGSNAAAMALPDEPAAPFVSLGLK